jgi:hypothetical protein
MGHQASQPGDEEKESKNKRGLLSDGPLPLHGDIGQVVTMNESAVSFHTPQAKQQRKQWLRKDMPGLIKAKVHVTRTKKIGLGLLQENWPYSMQTTRPVGIQ